MSKQNARRLSDLKFLDLNNIIKSPENEYTTRRCSKRIGRKSISSNELEETIKLMKPVRRRKSILTKKPVEKTNLVEPYSNELKAETNGTASVSDRIHERLISISQQNYVPPQNVGLSTILEQVPERRSNRDLKKSEKLLLRCQIFTGQTLEEASTPRVPGVAPLDPELIQSVTRKRVLSRQRRAKKLGFKGIAISKATETRFVKFLSEMHSFEANLSQINY